MTMPRCTSFMLSLLVSCSMGEESVHSSPESAPTAAPPRASAPRDGPPDVPRDGPPRDEWLVGDADERFSLVAKHLRGFDMAMVEVGYRYTELYWAGHDRNWDYAEYQLGKIETAVAHGVQRRPKRATSARMLEGGVTTVRAAIDARDAVAFAEAFEVLTTICNACHQAEGVAFMNVAPPTMRHSPIRSPSGESSGPTP